MAKSRASTEIQQKLKSKRSSQRLFVTVIPHTCKLFFNSGTFILTKLGSISLTEIVLKNRSCKQHKAATTSYFSAKDFTPHKPHFRATFIARPRVTGNTKIDYFRSFCFDSFAPASVSRLLFFFFSLIFRTSSFTDWPSYLICVFEASLALQMSMQRWSVHCCCCNNRFRAPLSWSQARSGHESGSREDSCRSCTIELKSSAQRRTGLWIRLFVVLVCWIDSVRMFHLSLQWRICQRRQLSHRGFACLLDLNRSHCRFLQLVDLLNKGIGRFCIPLFVCSTAPQFRSSSACYKVVNQDERSTSFVVKMTSDSVRCH